MEEDFKNNLNYYRIIMNGFKSVPRNEHGTITIDDINEYINNEKYISTNSQKQIDFNRYALQIFQLMNEKFIQLLKIMNQIENLGYNRYKTLQKDEIIENLFSILGCWLGDFISILWENLFFDKYKPGFFHKYRYNPNDKFGVNNMDDQQRRHFDKHGKFIRLISSKDTDALLKDNEHCRRMLNDRYDTFKEEKDRRYLEIYQQNQRTYTQPNYFNHDKEPELFSAGKKGGKKRVRKLKKYA